MSRGTQVSEPLIIQGGMGVGVSSWQLARAVALAGQLGVVSGTAIDAVLARRLQLGDSDGAIRRALAEFPYPEMAERVIKRYYIAGGKAPDVPFLPTPVLSTSPTQEQLELVVVANFAEVYLAREGHEGLVGINFLEKIQTPTLPSLFGALLAGVDYVLMGAGIPRAIPGILDRLVEGQAVELPLSVQGAGTDDHYATHFDPQAFTRNNVPWLERPKFLPIVASATLASMLARKSTGRVDGFVVEGPTAGGHNAPPRGAAQWNDRGEPIYGPRDEVDLQAIGALGLPFWLAGSYGSPAGLARALQRGAAGIQVGTALAFCQESGLHHDLKDRVLHTCRHAEPVVITDPVASPTGFPFKVLQLAGSMSESSVYEARQRRCDLGFLRQAYCQADGQLGWRCPGEPQAAYVHKGGTLEETVGRKCLCNGLMANIGLGQVRRSGQREAPLVTCGDDVRNLRQFLGAGDEASYTAAQVIEYLLSEVDGSRAVASAVEQLPTLD